MELAALPEGAKYTQDQGLKYEQLRALGMNVPRMIQALRGEGDVNRDILNIALSPEQRQTMDIRNEEIIEQEMETFIINFTNERIQNPGAANRPLFVQDPHFAMLTVFNGFLSTVTANLVPKLWNDKVGLAIRQKNPTLAYNAFAVMVTMIAMGAVGQWMKDYLKHGKTSPYLDSDQLFHRALLSSGVFGQYEKIADIAYPLYPQHGESAGTRAAEGVFGASGRLVETLGRGVSALGSDTAPEGTALNNFLKAVPGTSVLPWARDLFTGRESSEISGNIRDFLSNK